MSDDRADIVDELNRLMAEEAEACLLKETLNHDRRHESGRRGSHFCQVGPPTSQH